LPRFCCEFAAILLRVCRDFAANFAATFKNILPRFYREFTATLPRLCITILPRVCREYSCKFAANLPRNYRIKRDNLSFQLISGKL
jgi:hypothetical protein